MMDCDSIFSKAQCSAIFIQPTTSVFGTDTFVINFVKGGDVLSFHSFSMVRLLFEGEVAYSIADHYINDRGLPWRRGQKKLSSTSFQILKSILVGKCVTHFKEERCGDVIIEFENSAVLEFLIDTGKAAEKTERHRLLVFKGGWDSEAQHFVFWK
ncbi:MAG: hypothetical protein K6B51_05780 [Bacilli bacterium]|nr:hypothetical protein [Bacilli bacterium]